ncbi:MAG: hypothetical protein F6K36_22820 [Symploca sp. SIO3C6]|nr:hypothetical protein [Symploca sp. SIO3C6]
MTPKPRPYHNALPSELTIPPGVPPIVRSVVESLLLRDSSSARKYLEQYLESHKLK